ncbi:hypothetical protein [Ulvibacter sp. MAR_2010_11]|nr:hypothetical protein [Ulvibacter sp. MAR_2010_11]
MLRTGRGTPPARAPTRTMQAITYPVLADYDEAAWSIFSVR